jgi:hypothetical protein
MEQFKQNNPTYYKSYYQNNIHKFKERNDHRNSSKKWNYIIEINGKKYVFKHKKDVQIKKINIQDITDAHCIVA